jgi:hypothetical protein
MKTNKRFWKRGAWGLFAAGAVVALVCGMSANHSKGLVIHEWGTFTSVQGGDGQLMSWHPLESSQLPGFVYDWKNPGLNRKPLPPPFAMLPGGGLSKAGMLTWQRMETPVIYFYSEQPEVVDVSVDFPQGLITEWYPQATQIGPSSVAAPPVIKTLDQYAHKVGVKPSFTFASLLKEPGTKASRARWGRIEVLGKNGDLERELPTDKSGSHYFSARETDSSFLQLDSLVATNRNPETEKFIFYRGVGSFATPLRVTAQGAGELTLTNTGSEPLEHLFAMTLKNGAGKFVYVERLGPGEQRSVKVESGENTLPVAKLSEQLGQQMAQALEKEGLYAREAGAMVKTWRDSWFEEDGTRVLFVLPSAWTSRTLPMKTEPRPKELVRVMVGRAEVLTPARVDELTGLMQKAGDGNGEAKEQVVAQLRKLGRFAEPAMSLATRNVKREVNQAAWGLYQSAVKQGNAAL